MRLFNFLSAILTLTTGLSAVAADLKMTIPVFSQKLELSYPAQFKVASQGAQGNVFMMEFIPKTQSLQTWTELLVVSAYQGLAGAHTAETGMQLEADSIKAACPAHFVFEKLAYKHPQGYPVVLAIVGCSTHPTLTGQSELALQLTIQGKKDIFMVKKSFHRPVGAKSSVDKSNYKKMAAELLAVKLCKNDGAGPACVPEAP